MKKFIGVVVILFFVSITTIGFAADKAFDNGVNVIHLGIGFGIPGSEGSMKIPPILLGYERGVKVHPKVPLSFGGIVGIAQNEDKYSIYTYEWKYTYTYFVIGFRAAYHFEELLHWKKTDLYAGAMLGYNVVSSKVTTPKNLPAYVSSNYSASDSGITGGVYAGIRYYFTPMFGVYGEVGYNLGYINFGGVLKF